MDWALPENFSTQGEVIDQLFYIILVLTGIGFLLVEGGIIWFCLKYRRREGRSAHYTHGSNRLEIVWTVIPAVIIAILGGYSGVVWQDLRSESNRPQGGLEFKVVGKQFEWNVTYPGTDRTLGTEDDFVVRNQFHFPADEMVTVLLESEDVIHSFFIPQLRVKQDALPGKTIAIWFDYKSSPSVRMEGEWEAIGNFQIACAELCGLGHYRMHAPVTVHTAAGFDAWLASQASAAAQ